MKLLNYLFIIKFIAQSKIFNCKIVNLFVMLYGAVFLSFIWVKILLGECLSRTSTKHGACGGAHTRSCALKDQD